MVLMILIGGRSSGCSSLLGGSGCGRALGRSSLSSDRRRMNVEPTSSDELLDLISELNALLHIVAMVTMIKAELVRIAFSEVCAYPFRPWQLLPDLHQYLSFWDIERGVVVKSF